MLRCSVTASSPAPLAVATATTARRPPSTLPILPRDEHQPQLRLPAPAGETTAALRRRRGLAVVVRAENSSNVQLLPEPNHFAEETELISKRFMQIYCTFEGYLYKEAIEMSAAICLSAEKAVAMASQVEDSAWLLMTACTAAAAAAEDDAAGTMTTTTISAHTVHLTLRPYVHVFVDTAEASYKRLVLVKTVTSFVDALRGLVCISHVLLDAALEVEALGRTHPRQSLPEYDDVKSMRRDYDCEMAHLQDAITKATTTTQIRELMLPTILQGEKATRSLLGVMEVRQRRALEKAS